MGRVSEFDRIRIITLEEAGKGQREISRITKFGLSTVQKILKKWKQYKTTKNLSRGHRSKKLSKRSQRWLNLFMKMHPRSTLQDVVHAVYLYLGISLHKNTVRKYLRSLGLHSRVAAKKTMDK